MADSAGSRLLNLQVNLRPPARKIEGMIDQLVYLFPCARHAPMRDEVILIAGHHRTRRTDLIEQIFRPKINAMLLEQRLMFV
jgi:hypothetical protein